MFAWIKNWMASLFHQPQQEQSRDKDDFDPAVFDNYPTATALQLVRSVGEGFTRIGGHPTVPPGFVWPMRGKTPLGFLAQVDLSEAGKAWDAPPGSANDTLDISELPASGALYFFIDYENEPWGIDTRDVDGFAVIYCPDLADAAPMRPPTAPAGVVENPAESVMSFRRMESCLPLEIWANSGERDLYAEEADAFEAMMDKAFQNSPHHQLLGFPDPVQYPEMNKECADMAQKAFGADTGEAKDWKLLLQIDTDDDLDLLWGDMGKVYFWINRNDLRARRFDRMWAVTQCS